jgi:phosphoglycolate phosphatase
VLVGGHALAGSAGDPDLGLQLAHERGRHPPVSHRDPPGRARGLGRLMAESGTQAILFDIDGTLVSTGGASDRAWKRAFKELQGVDVDVPAVTGKGVPDPEVGRVVFEKAIGREPTAEEAEALMRRRIDFLPEEVENSPGFAVKEGVVELLENLQAAEILLGLTTGNVEEAAQIKLARADLNRFFSFGGYGSDSSDRTELTRKALERAEQIYGEGFDRDRCFSCGDTPRDVEAGHGAGIRVVGVATGEYSVEELKEAGADAAVASLREGLPLLSRPDGG